MFNSSLTPSYVAVIVIFLIEVLVLAPIVKVRPERIPADTDNVGIPYSIVVVLSLQCTIRVAPGVIFTVPPVFSILDELTSIVIYHSS
jgi:hypothetical protein